MVNPMNLLDLCSEINVKMYLHHKSRQRRQEDRQPLNHQHRTEQPHVLPALNQVHQLKAPARR